ncbi:uncharacterized protein LOC134238182 [Saccostrea cucullata]|uniref:uncharacterized protein LOC134238182 n=1 Tax=Saccostrea cuccullata TaxID=36930 RepID=UPI002ED5367E
MKDLIRLPWFPVSVPKWCLRGHPRPISSAPGIRSTQPETRRRMSPLAEAAYYCRAGLDKDGFQVKYISDYKGFGVFSTTRHCRGDFLLQYVGERMLRSDALERIDTSYENKMFFYKYDGKEFCIDAEGVVDHICALVNDGHGDQANSAMKLQVFDGKEHLCLFANKDIHPGEEILYDYGEDESKLWWRRKNINNADDPYSFVASSDVESDPFSLRDISDSDSLTSSFLSDDEINSEASNLNSHEDDSMEDTSIAGVAHQEVDSMEDTSIKGVAHQEVDSMEDTSIKGVAHQEVDSMEDTSIKGVAHQEVDNMEDTSIEGVAHQEVDNMDDTTIEGVAHQEVDSMVDTGVAEVAHQEVDSMEDTSIAGLAHQEVDSMEHTGIAEVAHQEVDSMEDTGIEGVAHQEVDSMEDTGIEGVAHQEVDSMEDTNIAEVAHQEVDSIEHTGMEGVAHQEVDSMEDTGIEGVAHQEVDSMEDTGIAEVAHQEVDSMEDTGIAGLAHQEVDSMEDTSIAGMAHQEVDSIEDTNIAAEQFYFVEDSNCSTFSEQVPFVELPSVNRLYTEQDLNSQPCTHDKVDNDEKLDKKRKNLDESPVRALSTQAKPKKEVLI